MKEMSSYRKMLANLNRAKAKAKLETKKIKAECPHKSQKGKLWIKKVRGEEGIFKCTECRTKINLNVFENDRKQNKKAIKKVFKDAINMIDVMKLTISPKVDRRVMQKLAECQKQLYWTSGLAVGVLNDELKPHKKDKKRKNKKNRNSIGYGALQ